MYNWRLHRIYGIMSRKRKFQFNSMETLNIHLLWQWFRWKWINKDFLFLTCTCNDGFGSRTYVMYKLYTVKVIKMITFIAVGKKFSCCEEWMGYMLEWWNCVANQKTKSITCRVNWWRNEYITIAYHHHDNYDHFNIKLLLFECRTTAHTEVKPHTIFVIDKIADHPNNFSVSSVGASIVIFIRISLI